MTTSHRTTSSRLGLAGLALVLGTCFLTSCGGSDDKGDGDATSSAAGAGNSAGATGDASQGSGKGDKGGQDAGSDGSGSAASGSGSDTGSDTGSGGAGKADPDSPFVVAAAAVGTRSRETVVTLHALGVSTTNDSGIPHALLPDQGQKLRGALHEQAVAASRLTPPKGSAAARLVSSLHAYGRVAGQLAGWSPDAGPLPREWFRRLGQADATWLKALRDLSDASGDDLLDGLPDLLMPAT